jgi:hypothetical protein
MGAQVSVLRCPPGLIAVFDVFHQLPAVGVSHVRAELQRPIVEDESTDLAALQQGLSEKTKTFMPGAVQATATI